MNDRCGSNHGQLHPTMAATYSPEPIGGRSWPQASASDRQSVLVPNTKIHIASLRVLYSSQIVTNRPSDACGKDIA